MIQIIIRLVCLKKKMIQGFTMIRGTLMTDKATKLSDVEVEFDFIQSTLRTIDGRTLVIGKSRDICL